MVSFIIIPRPVKGVILRLARLGFDFWLSVTFIKQLNLSEG